MTASTYAGLNQFFLFRRVEPDTQSIAMYWANVITKGRPCIDAEVVGATNDAESEAFNTLTLSTSTENPKQFVGGTSVTTSRINLLTEKDRYNSSGAAQIMVEYKVTYTNGASSESVGCCFFNKVNSRTMRYMWKKYFTPAGMPLYWGA